MKSKCSFILKASTALVLALLMLFGTVTTSIAAVVDNAKNTAEADATESEAHGAEGFFAALRRNTPDLADTGKKADLAETGAVLVDYAVPTYVTCHMNLSGYTTSGSKLSAYGDPSFSKDNGDSNHWIYNFYTQASQSNKTFNWKINAGGDKWFGMGGHSFSAQQESSYNNYLYENGADDKVSTISATSGWVHMYIDLWRSYGSNTYMSNVKFYQTAVTALSSSVSVGSSSLSMGGTTTVTPSSSGGTGTPTNSVKVYQGSTSGTDVTSSVLSGTTFTAPTVTSATTYYIVNTATDPTIKSYSVASSTKTITVNPASYSITYKDQGDAAFSGTHASGYPTTHTYGTATTLKSASKTGYTFGGWFTNSNCTGTAVTSLGATDYTSNITLYAKWTQKTYAITLSETGGSGTMKIDGTTCASGYAVTHGSHTFRVDAPSGYVIDTISGIGTWTKASDNSYATLGSTSITAAQTISVTYAAAGRPSLAEIDDVTKDANTTTFNVTATINDEDKKSGTLTATASSGTTSVATVGTPTVSGSTVTIPVTIKGVVGSSSITVTLKDGGTDVSTQTFSVSMEEPTFTIANKSVYVYHKNTTAATVTNGGVAPSSIAYTSGNTSYVTVNATTGKLTAASVQTSSKSVTMTAEATYASGYTKSTTYTVTLQAPTLTAASSATSGNIGDTATGSCSGTKPDPTSASYVSGYSWSSSDSNVVDISNSTSATPTFTFKKNGSATITLTVTYKNTGLTKTATTSISVSTPTVAFSSSSDASINVGGTVKRTATGSTLGSGATGTVAYSGTNEYINVASDGTVTGLKPTSAKQTVTATYTVTCGGQTTTATATYKVTVTAPTVSITSASTANVGATVSLAASSTGATTTPTYTWTVTNGTGTASLSGTTLTAKTPGTVTVKVTATYNAGYSKEATQTFTVKTPAVSLSGNAKVAVGDTITLTPSVTNVTGTPTYTYSSSATSKATVTNAGKVTGVAAGTATITVTATLGTWSDTATKSITVEAPSLTIKDGSTSVVDGTVYTTIGTNKTLDVGTNFSDALTVKSSKTSVATVSYNSSTGKLTITPVAKGITKISVSTDSGVVPTAAALAETAAAMPQGLLRKVLEIAATGAVATQTAQFNVNVAEAESGHVVYLTDNAGWGSAVIHSWGTDGSGAITDHAAMTKVGVNNSNQDVYAYRFTDAQWAQVKHIRFLKSSSTTWDGNADQTVTITSFTSNAWYTTNSNSPRGVGTWNCTLQKPQIQASNVTVDMGGTQTMTATVLTSGTPSTFNWSSGTTSVATTANTHTASNVITGVAPGDSTITIKAYANKTSDFKSIVTDGTADDFVAGTTTATATVVAENKTVTFGAKKTDNGSDFTNLSGAVTAKYYDEDTSSGSGSGSSGSGSSGSGTGAGKYMWYNTNNSKDLNAATSAGEMIDLGDGTCYGSFTCAAGQNYDVIINTSSTKGSCLNSSTTVTGNQTWAKVENNGTTYWALDSYSAAVPIYVIYNPTANSVRFTTTNPASSGSSGSGSSGSGSGSSGSSTGYTGEGTVMTSPQSVPYGKVAVFTAEATKEVGSVTYYFAEWVDGSNNTLSTETEYAVKITDAKTVYARYYQVYKLSAFDSYALNGTDVTFVTAPPKLITVKHGADTYIYNYSGTASTGNPDSPVGDSNHAAALPIESGTYGQGNYIQYYAGDEITLYYTAMASSEIFKGVFYNNSANYYVAKPTAQQFVAHDYSAAKTLYMNSNYYQSVPSGLPSTTVDADAHSIKFTGNQDYKNIDIEIATKRKVYFSDYTNAVIGSKNTDDYYSDGEALSVTGDQLTVAAAKSSSQTNTIVGANVEFYKATAQGGKGDAVSASDISTYHLAVTNATSTSTSSANGTALVISGEMPPYDLYIDLNMTNSYTIKLGSKIISDTFANKTRLADEVASITIKEGSTTKLTAPSNADVTNTSASVSTGTALTLTTAWNSGWSQYYTFVGWYWGNSDNTAPDYEKGFISDKMSLSYTPKKGGTIWAVGTRTLYINGSKYITGKSTDWYGENKVQKNLPMSFDAESGRYYWEITDTMFAAAGSNYKTWYTTNWDNKDTSFGYYNGGDGTYYWTDNDDKYHGKSFFQILDKESGSTDKTVWDSITSFREDTPANGPTYGKIYPKDYNDDYYKKHDGQGFINFNETDYDGQSSPLRIYFDPSKSGNARLTVESTKIYSNLYVSNGFTVGSTLRTSNVTVEPVVDGAVKTSGQTGYFSVGKQGTGWDPDVEGHVNHYKPQKKGATVRITKTAGGSDKIVAFFIYDITNKTVRAERDVKNSGSKYYIDLTLANEEQNLYIVPIVEEAGANVTITFDATQLNRKQWGDIVTAYAWYSGTGGNALGGYPGQPMIPSDDMTTWTTTFKGTNSNNDELQGITFSNYVDGIHSWLGCSGVMGTVSDHTTGTASGGIVNVYNHVDSGTNGEYSRTNFKAQTYDYREPIALYDRFKSQDHVSISFSMKDGNSSLISWRHQDLTSGDNILNPSSEAWRLNFEYLTNAKGDKYIDMNGNTMKTKPTASFYVAAKGQVLYNNSSMTNVFYSGKNYDSVSGVTYGAASGIGMNYAVEWYVYDASGNYITNVLTAGIADLASNNVDSYIGKRLEDMGYAVDGKSVAICYDKPRYMYGDSNAASSGQAAGYNGKGINCGANFDAYRFTGQWNAVANNELVNVKVGVGMMTDSGEKLAVSNTAGYGNASASYDTTKGNNTRVTDEDGNEAPFTASDGSFVRTAVRDASNSPVKLNASAQNFIGWYYYDANTGDFVKANYASNENFYPNYSNKDVTFYAMYRASAIYQYKYTGREGERTYSASGEDLTEAELNDNSRIVAASHEADIKNKVPVGIGIFKKTIDFSPTSYDSWTKTPDQEGYILDITGFTTGIPVYTLTAHYKNASGEDQTITKTSAYNGGAVNLTTLHGGSAVTTAYGEKFLGWYAYDNAEVGDLLSTQANYGLQLTRDQAIIAVYENDSTALPTDGWSVHIDENEVNKELTTKETGVFYNDTIVRVRKGSDVKATLPTGAKFGVLLVNDNKTGKAINSFNETTLLNLISKISNGNTAKASGLSITRMEAETQTSFNRTDIAVRSDFAKSNGTKYCVYAYFYDGSNYHFSDASAIKTYE